MSQRFEIGARIRVKMRNPKVYAHEAQRMDGQTGTIKVHNESSFNALKPLGPAYLVTFDVPIQRVAQGWAPFESFWFDPSELEALPADALNTEGTR